MSILKDVIEGIKKNHLNNDNRDKSYERLCRLELKYEIMHNLVISILS